MAGSIQKFNLILQAFVELLVLGQVTLSVPIARLTQLLFHQLTHKQQVDCLWTLGVKINYVSYI